MKVRLRAHRSVPTWCTPPCAGPPHGCASAAWTAAACVGGVGLEAPVTDGEAPTHGPNVEMFSSERMRLVWEAVCLEQKPLSPHCPPGRAPPDSLFRSEKGLGAGAPSSGVREFPEFKSDCSQSGELCVCERAWPQSNM